MALLRMPTPVEPEQNVMPEENKAKKRSREMDLALGHDQCAFTING